MTDDTEWVYVSSSNQGRCVYHTDRDCGVFNPTVGTIVRKRRDQVPHLDLCKHCAGEARRPDNKGRQLSAMLYSMDPEDVP